MEQERGELKIEKAHTEQKEQSMCLWSWREVS